MNIGTTRTQPTSSMTQVAAVATTTPVPDIPHDLLEFICNSKYDLTARQCKDLVELATVVVPRVDMSANSVDICAAIGAFKCRDEGVRFQLASVIVKFVTDETLASFIKFRECKDGYFECLLCSDRLVRERTVKHQCQF